MLTKLKVSASSADTFAPNCNERSEIRDGQ